LADLRVLVVVAVVMLCSLLLVSSWFGVQK
jgi:hypothetical protein